MKPVYKIIILSIMLVAEVFPLGAALFRPDSTNNPSLDE